MTETCGECEGEGELSSGIMLVRPPAFGVVPFVGTVAAPREKPLVLMHPDLAARVKPLIEDAPRDVPAFTLKGFDVFVDDKVPLVVPCKDCGGTGSV